MTGASGRIKYSSGRVFVLLALLKVFEINVDSNQINVAACLTETGCSGFIQLDVAKKKKRVEGLGLLEGTDPEPLLTLLVITRAALLFSYKHGVRGKDK